MGIKTTRAAPSYQIVWQGERLGEAAKATMDPMSYLASDFGPPSADAVSRLA